MIIKAIRVLYSIFYVCCLLCIGIFDSNPLIALSVALVGSVCAIHGKHLEKKYNIEW